MYLKDRQKGVGNLKGVLGSSIERRSLGYVRSLTASAVVAPRKENKFAFKTLIAKNKYFAALVTYHKLYSTLVTQSSEPVAAADQTFSECAAIMLFVQVEASNLLWRVNIFQPVVDLG